MKSTPLYGLPYLESSDPIATALTAASKGQAEAIEAAMQARGVTPPASDLNSIIARLNALEADVSGRETLPVMTLKRTTNIAGPSSWTDFAWQSSTIVGDGLTTTANSPIITCTRRMILLFIYQGTLQSADELGLRILDKAGGVIFSGGGRLPSPSWTNALITNTTRVVPGDILRTQWRTPGGTPTLDANQTSINVIGLRPW